MNINKNSWHYKAYDWSYWDERAPEQTNLCQYVRRIMVVLPLKCFGVGLLIAIFVPIFVLVVIPIGFIIGYYPTNPWGNNTEPFLAYPGLRFGKSYNAFQLYPWHIIVAAVVALLEWAWFHYCSWVYPVATQGGILAVIGLIFFFLVAPDTDTYQVAHQWLAARKQGVCPLVEFVDNSTPKE